MIDHHCHPFALEAGPLDLSHLDLDVTPGEQALEARDAARPTTLWHALLHDRLAGFLRCDLSEVADARQDAAERDYRSYVRRLFEDADLDTLLVDPAWPLGWAEQRDIMADLTGCGVHLIFRVDPVVDRLLEEEVDFDAITERFDAALDRAAQDGFVGLKTILAYRTGLAVQPDVTARQARESMDAEVPVRRRAKPLRDLLFRRTLRFSAEHKMPLQIHTGFGDSEIRLSEAHPLLLEEILRTPEGTAAPIVLIHGSFPYHEEAAYLAATRANVHVDFSLFNLFVPGRLSDRVMRLVELTPTNKLLAGTDGFALPETHWFGAILAHEAWEQVRRWLQDDLRAPAEWIAKAEDAVFADNARRLYRLTS